MYLLKKGLISNNYEGASEGITDGVRQFTFYNLPKVSLNMWYSGNHWTTRNNIKNEYKKLIPTLTNVHYPIEMSFRYYFKSNPLDADNCISMCKMITDILLNGNDGWNKVWIGELRSFKGTEDKVIVTIKNV